jgi:putative hydrolase of the HAD superfamily
VKHGAYPWSVTRADVSHVLFDLDETLVDHRGAATAALGQAIVRWSPDASNHDRDELLALWRQLEQVQYDAYLRGECTHAEQRVRRLDQFLRTLGVASGDDAFLTAQFQHYLDAYVAAWSHFADVPSSLDELRAAGIGVAILTNGEPGPQRLKLERTGLVDRFDRILTPTEVGAPKPDARAFVNACTILGIDPERTAYVGDNLEVDAVGASAAGLRGIWLDRSGSVATAPPGVVRITSLSALLSGALR